jgi:hypothetical protein
MATPQTYQNDVVQLNVVETQKNIIEMNKLFAAAVVNSQFCHLLLNEPETALQQGYLGDAFDLTLDEQALIISIRANSLPELARQVTKALER